MRILCIALALVIVACDESGAPAWAPSATRSPRPAARSPQPVVRPSPSPAPFDDQAFAAALQASGLPVTNVRVLTADNDPNELLGRPNQYVGKVSWTDARVQVGQPTAELFADDASMEARFTYLDNNFRRTPVAFQYMYRNDPKRILLRVPKDLTPAQAGEYETWLKKL
ncbi:MAG TPA: hypothetical protein VGR87_02130 [Candidatus Limnocylindria bacterium]|nr:hypothetical protein [Candidatus Limnocylindria bacterium]